MAHNYYSDNEYIHNQSQGTLPFFPQQMEEEESSFNIMEWVFRFLKYWYIFVVAVVITMGLAYLKNRSWKPMYMSEAKVLIESSNSASQYSFMQGFGGMDMLNTNNQLLILGSYDLINRSVNKLPFDIDYYTRGRFKTNSLYGREPIQISYTELSPDAYMCEFRFIPIDDNSFEIVVENEVEDAGGNLNYSDFVIRGKYGEMLKNNLFFGKIDKLYLPLNSNPNGFLFRFRSERSLEDEFYDRLSLSYIGESSSVIAVSLTGSDVNRDGDFLNMLTNEFLATNLEEKNEEAKRTIDFINEQLSFISDSLKNSEIKLRQYRRENNLVDVNGYTSTILNKLSALDTRRSELNLQEAYFNSLSEYLGESVTDESLVAPSSLGISDPILLELVNEFNDFQQRRSDVGVKNPNYERYTKKMEEVRRTLVEVLSNVKNIYSMERAAFEKEYNQTLGELKELPEKELAMINYERAYKVNDNYYTFLLQKQSEAQIRQASNVPDNKILQGSRLSPLPVNSGDKAKVYLIFFLVGLILPAAFIVLKELLNVTISDENDVNKLTKLPVIGGIRHAINSGTSILARSSKSIYTEGYRMIRTRIGFIVQGKEQLLITVTSAESGDGKTHFVQDLASIYGMVSDKVVLVDIDIRNPNLSKELKLRNNKGIVHAIIGEATIDEVICRNEGTNYDFIPAGTIPPNPAELLSSKKFKALLQELCKRYEYVIFDTSPLGLVSDAYAISSLSDINLVITRANKSNKNVFRNFTRQIVDDKMENVYIVLNDIEATSANKYGKYSFGYYGGKYGYGTYAYAEDKYYANDKKYYDED